MFLLVNKLFLGQRFNICVGSFFVKYNENTNKEIKDKNKLNNIWHYFILLNYLKIAHPQKIIVIYKLRQ